MTVFNTRSVTTTATTTSATSTITTTPESMSEGSSSCGSTARQLSNNAHATAGEAAPSNVSDNNVVFPVGSVLECRNVLNSTTVGQVICSDQPTRLLVLSLYFSQVYS